MKTNTTQRRRSTAHVNGRHAAVTSPEHHRQRQIEAHIEEQAMKTIGKTSQFILLLAGVLMLTRGQLAVAQFILGEPTHLGEPIETSRNEFGPDLSADGLTLYYQKGTYAGNPDIYSVTRDSLDGAWKDPQPVAFNTDRGEGSPALSPDGRELYFSDGNRPGYPAPVRPGGMGGVDIWVSSWNPANNTWGEPANLGAPVNGPFHDYGPNLSSDGLELYFSSNRPGGFGNTDIWVARRPTLNAAWDEPVNIGPLVNGGSDDERPALSPGGRILIFGSNRPGGMGIASTLWVSMRERIEDDWGAPVVLSSKVNGPYWTFEPEFSPDGATLFYGRFDSGVGNSVWQVPILSGVDPQNLVQAWRPIPGNGTMDSRYNETILSWVAGHFAESHDLFLGLSWDDVNSATSDSTTYLGTQLETTYALDGLAFGQTYYWRVDEVNSAPDFTVFKGDVWSFTAAFSIPAAHWALDETEGMVVADSAGNNNGYALGDPIWQPDGGQVNGALEFDGVDDFISAPAVLNPADGAFSVLAWVKGGAPGQVVLSQIAGANWLSTDPSG